MGKTKDLSYEEITKGRKEEKLRGMLKNPTTCRIILCLINWFRGHEVVQSFQIARIMYMSRVHIHEILDGLALLGILKRNEEAGPNTILFEPIRNDGKMVLEHYDKVCRDRLKLGV